MFNFLAVDFGTSNCVAGYLRLVDGAPKLKLILLDGQDELLSSVLFVRHPNLPPVAVDEDRYRRRLSEALRRDEQRVRLSEEEIERRVQAFFNANRPRTKKPPEAGDYCDDRAYKRAFIAYQNELKVLPVATADFIANQLEPYKRKQREFLARPTPIERIERKVRLAMMREASEARARILWETSFFGALLRDDMETLFGREAIEEYSADPLGGFFMRSPKAFLAVPLVGDRREIFVRAVSRILTLIKKRAEEQSGTEYGGIVLGRPVNFMGAGDSIGNDQALRIMTDAARRAGFAEVRFVMEPLAAALAVRTKALSTTDPILVVDIGGGTTDLAFIDVNTDSDVSFMIKGVVGRRIGGNDFDEAIAWSVVAPFLGRGARLVSGSDVPIGVVGSALATRDLAKQSAFRNSGDQIENWLANSSTDSKVQLSRLYQLYTEQLQHRVMLSTEGLKRRVGIDFDPEELFDFFEDEFVVALSADALSRACSRQLEAIGALVAEVSSSCNPGHRPVRVYLTGGMSQSVAVQALLRDLLPSRSTFEMLPPMKAVVGGLSIVARQLSQSPSVAVEPSLIRGVPIQRA